MTKKERLERLVWLMADLKANRLEIPSAVETIIEVLIDMNCPAKSFKPPTPEEIEQAGKEMGYTVNGQEFCDFYGCKNWMVGKSKMKNWKMALGRACRDGWCLREKTFDEKFQVSLPDGYDEVLNELFGEEG